MNRSPYLIDSTGRLIVLAGLAAAFNLLSVAGAAGQTQSPTDASLIRQTASLAPSSKNLDATNVGPDSTIRRFQPGQEPVMVPPISFVDVNSGRFGKLDLELIDGQFLDTGVDKLHLSAKNLDVKDGTLKSLEVDVQGGHLKDFIFDRLNLQTRGELAFDAGIFLNHHLLQFSQPAEASISALISQESLNTFLHSPKILDRLSVSAGKRANSIASALGFGGGNVGLNITNAQITLQKHNKIAIRFTSNLGVGGSLSQNQIGLPIDGEIEGKIVLIDGNLALSETRVVAAAQELPPQLVNVLLNKINSIANALQKSNDIRFQFSELKVIPGKNIQLKGQAVVSRLRFGG
jgi:hypothetical protein